MSEGFYEYGDTDELAKREHALRSFLERVFAEEERPYFVADDACVYDFFAGDDDEFIATVYDEYGVRLNVDDLRLPVWKLLDKLSES